MSGNWTSPTPKGNNPGSSQLAKPQGPPYASRMAIVGGVPSPAIDDPIAVVLMLLFLLSAAAHMAILRINKARQLKFVFSGMLFALCLLRGVSLVARMIWASYPDTVNAVIAASVMTQCGSVLIFIINLFFAQRVLRAYHPRLGWHRGACYAVWFLIACVLCCLVMAIIATIHSFFTLSRRAREADRAVQLFAGSYLAFLAFLPVPVVALAVAARYPRRHYRVEKFGAGRWRAKVGLLIFTSLVATLGAGFRVGVNFDGRPGADPAWFHSRACYYCFNFVTDLVVSTAYLLARFDRRFIVPDGARGPGDYSPISPVVPSATNSKTNLVSGKLPMMGSEKPLVMMRQGSISGHTIVTPFKPFTPTASPPQSRPPSRSPTPSPKPSGNDNDNDNGNTTTANTSTCYNTDSSATAVRTSPTTSSSLNRGKPPSRHDYNPLAQHPQNDEPLPPPQPPMSQIRPRSALKSTTSAAAGRMSRLGRMSGGRSVMRSVRMRINSEADAYGPDGSSCFDEGGHATDTDPLVAHPSNTNTNTNTKTTATPTPTSRQRYRYHYPNRHFLGRSRGGDNINESGSANASASGGGGSGNNNSSVRAPAPAHLGPPILPDLDLDLELLSATLLAPWALDGWGFSSASRRISGSRWGGRNNKTNNRNSRNSRNSRNNDDDDGVYSIAGGGDGGNIADDPEFMMSGGSGEESNRSSNESNGNGDSTGGDANNGSDSERSRSGESSCTYSRQAERARTM